MGQFVKLTVGQIARKGEDAYWNDFFNWSDLVGEKCLELEIYIHDSGP